MQHLVAVRDYSALKDMAEASAVAGQVPFISVAHVLMAPHASLQYEST